MKNKQAGNKRTLTPEQTSAIKSQWARYKRATDLVPDSFVISGRPGDGASGSEDFTVKYFKPENLPLMETLISEPDYYVTVRKIGDAVIKLYEQVFEETTPDGAIVEQLGTYQVTEVLEGITQDYLVISDEGNTIALIASGTNVIRALGDPVIVQEQLRKGTSIGYACTCMSYKNQNIDIVPSYTGDPKRTWGEFGAFGICKHIIALRYQNGDPINPPTDIPMNDMEEPRRYSSIKGKLPKRGKGMR
jgi:hypothetical protein